MKSRKKTNLKTSSLYFASLFKAKVPDKEDSSRQRGGHPPVGWAAASAGGEACFTFVLFYYFVFKIRIEISVTPWQDATTWFIVQIEI